MLFGLDCYGLFRQVYNGKSMENFKFNCISSGEYELYFDKEKKIIQKLIKLQEIFLKHYYECYKNISKEYGDMEKQLIFSAACMYIPDIPCRVIDEGIEELCILFYARGCMFLHELMLKIYGRDELSSDVDGKLYKRWEFK